MNGTSKTFQILGNEEDPIFNPKTQTLKPHSVNIIILAHSLTLFHCFHLTASYPNASFLSKKGCPLIASHSFLNCALCMLIAMSNPSHTWPGRAINRQRNFNPSPVGKRQECNQNAIAWLIGPGSEQGRVLTRSPASARVPVMR